MSRQRLTKSELHHLIGLDLRSQLGCRDVQVIVGPGDPNGANWTIEVVGLPAPHRCRDAVERIVAGLRARYDLAKDLRLKPTSPLFSSAKRLPNWGRVGASARLCDRSCILFRLVSGFPTGPQSLAGR